jgi:hypothetical protein
MRIEDFNQSVFRIFKIFKIRESYAAVDRSPGPRGFSVLIGSFGRSREFEILPAIYDIP